MKINKSEKDKVESDAVCQVVRHSTFFSFLLFKLSLVQTDRVPTFATDGRNLFYNPEFSATLNVKQCAFVLVHEIWHCAQGHIHRCGLRDRTKWNMAIDYETNWTLSRSSSKLPEHTFEAPTNILLDNQYANMPPEEIYLLIPDPPPQQGQEQGGESGEGEGGDKLKPWSDGCGQVIPPLDEGESDKIKSEWESNVVQAAKVCKQGTLPLGIDQLVRDLVEPSVHWEQLLSEYVSQLTNEEFSWAHPNKRYREVILPSRHSFGLGDLTFGIDTSGSTQPYWGKFLSEASALARDVKPNIMRVIQCDAAVHGVEEYGPADELSPDNIKIKGGGGTDFRPIFDYVRDNHNDTTVFVFLTDLYGTWPDYTPDYPVIFIVVGNDGGEIPFGRAIYIPQEQ